MKTKGSILKYSVLLALCVCIVSIVYFNDLEIPENERLSKEHFFDQQQKVENNFFASAFVNIRHQLAAVGSISKVTILLPIDFKKQERRLSCEVSALRMSLNYLGINVDEDELIDNLEFSTRKPRSGDVWGDPQKGFVGDINGSLSQGTGYGVYSEPIARLASKYQTARVIDGATLNEILAYAKDGEPVIVWGLLSSKYTIYWTSYEGKQIKVFPGEHARILMGYTGDISNPDAIILMDPLYGVVTINTDQFIKEWNLLDNMAVVVSST